jgi:hypothetical protein
MVARSLLEQKFCIALAGVAVPSTTKLTLSIYPCRSRIIVCSINPRFSYHRLGLFGSLLKLWSCRLRIQPKLVKSYGRGSDIRKVDLPFFAFTEFSFECFQKVWRMLAKKTSLEHECFLRFFFIIADGDGNKCLISRSMRNSQFKR